MRAEELKRIITLSERTDEVAKAYCNEIYNGNVAVVAEDILKEPIAVIDFLLTIIEKKKGVKQIL